MTYPVPGMAPVSAPALPPMPTDLSLQSADVPHGMHVVRVESVRYHQSQMGKGNGILVDVFHPEEGPCGWRINFTTDIRSAKYGPIKAGRLALALSGQSVDAEASLGAKMYAEMCTPANPAKGRWIQINARQGGANAKKPGEFYTEVEVVGPASAPNESNSLTGSFAAAPVAAPVAPAAPTGPTFPEAVQDFSAGQPGHGTHVYGASGAVYEKATGKRVQ